MRFLTSLITLFLFSLTLHGQENRVRTRQVDYTEYDRLINAVHYSKDKSKAIQALFLFVDKNFTNEDEEYFNARFTAVSYLVIAHNYSLAKEFYSEAINAYEKNFPFYNRGYSLVSTESLATMYLGLSTIYNATHLYEKNIRFLRSKQDFFESLKNPTYKHSFYAEMGMSLYRAEQYEEAIQVLLQLKQLAESGRLDYNVQLADSVYKINPAWPEETKQQLLKAKVVYEESMKRMKEQLVVSHRLDYSGRLANSYFQQYKFEECLPYAQQASDDLKLVYKFMDEVQQTSITTFSDPSIPDSIRRQVSRAQEYSRISNKLFGSAVYLVISAMKTNQPTLAEKYTTTLIERSLFNQLKGDFQEAEKNYTETFGLIRQLNKIENYGHVANNYSWINPYYLNLKVKSNQLTTALTQAQSIISEEEKKLVNNFQYFTENEKREFFKNYTKELERYYSLLLLLTEKGNDQTGELLNKILQTKGLILDATREQEKQLRKIKDKVTLAQIAEIKRLRDKLAAFYQQPPGNPATADSINRLSVRIGDLERAVNLKLVAVNIMKPVRWQDVQTRLKKGDVYLEILRLQRDNFEFDKPKIQYWALVIKPGESKPTLFQISEGEAFEIRSLRNYQNRVRTQSEDADSYNTYWKKINEQLQGAKTVIVSADGVYHIVNPVALQNPATKKFVLDEIEVKRVSTGRDLLAVADTNLPNKTIVLVGNPRFEMSRKQGGNVYRSNEVVPVEANENTRAGIEELPGTKKEVELISSKADGGGFQIKMLTGADANESNVKGLKSPAVLHLATHGQFDQLSKADTYLKSKLILAGAADTEPLSVSDYTLYEDGFLTAYEVTQLDLPDTRLVVLSACETGLGEIQSGEGVWGLQRAFQLAGARSVMGSLWKISDEATVTFMDAFYEQYLRTNNISEAYRQAMRITRQQYPQPYYWGAFTLIGAN